MQERIRAIETEYGGHKFRSRLEARWAIFFDACGAEWEYEPEGFELPNGTKYLPDFLLHEVRGRASGDLYVEVKGAMSANDAEKILRFCSPCGNLERGEIQNPVMVVTNIPDGETIHEITDSCSQIAYGSPSPAPFNFETIDGDCFAAHPGINIEGWFEVFGDDDNYLTGRDDELTLKAFKAARQARFEHGETPTRSDVKKLTDSDWREKAASYTGADKSMLWRDWTSHGYVIGIK